MAIDLGMTSIDTADVYGPCSNKPSEVLVGRALGDGSRERAVQATEVGVTVRDSAETSASAHPGRCAPCDDLPEDDFRRSLHRFQQDAPRVGLALVGKVRAIADRIDAMDIELSAADLAELDTLPDPQSGRR
ncbi:aldo/keto reductase [Streptomyces umbrinus]|uniref:aldo/keto reductase n=1 Tax=Streptomyces umbrinus TaxID=67370 RepID=UPI00343939BE